MDSDPYRMSPLPQSSFGFYESSTVEEPQLSPANYDSPAEYLQQSTSEAHRERNAGEGTKAENTASKPKQTRHRTLAQKIRKRQSDRRSQQLSRERNRFQLEQMKAKIEALESSDKNTQLREKMAEIAGLKEENRVLLEKLQSIQNIILTPKDGTSLAASNTHGKLPEWNGNALMACPSEPQINAIQSGESIFLASETALADPPNLYEVSAACSSSIPAEGIVSHVEREISHRDLDLCSQFDPAGCYDFPEDGDSSAIILACQQLCPSFADAGFLNNRESSYNPTSCWQMSDAIGDHPYNAPVMYTSLTSFSSNIVCAHSSLAQEQRDFWFNDWMVSRIEQYSHFSTSAINEILPKQPCLCAIFRHLKCGCNRKLSRDLAGLTLNGPYFAGGAEKVAQYALMHFVTRLYLLASQRELTDVPSFLHPQESQLTVPHPVYIDYLAWPALRDRLVHTYHQYNPVRVAQKLARCMSVNWKHSLTDVLAFENGEPVISGAFLRHILNFENWTLDPAWQSTFPDLKAV